ncbi:pentatricopeptide repeat-containing protein At4g39530 [Selaginella moellendorffii]|uniref:pentatricopeptide repeat-containing protein At4g39530 n=1 Tax=Selaginella moellendorffii TaxID=88036 RepID=UPI000D1C80DE|nr:pentatricopeptide repeat-containing protein At4g39530 [Selaginella moellendorffii]|eukprot:XP_024522041.1 pentatricopeptide repeat-containing protein At4g39530 [Selaginella moellendorffii]
MCSRSVLVFRRHGAAGHRMISTAAQQVRLPRSSPPGGDESLELAQNVVFPERKFPLYKRRATPESDHFVNLGAAVKQLDYMVDSGAYACLLKRCCGPAALEDGRRIHEHIVSHGRGDDVYLGNLLIQMYGLCKSVREANRVFRRMKEKNGHTWSFLIAANAVNGHCKKALEIYYRMLQHGVRPQERTFTTLVAVCGSFDAVPQGRMIHSQIEEVGYGSLVEVANSLVKMYGKFRLLDTAVGVFETIPCKNLTSYSAMVTAFAKCGKLRDAMRCFDSMWRAGWEPSLIIFTTILGVCAELGELEYGRDVHGMIAEVGLCNVHNLKVSLFDMYSRCGELEEAKKIFDSFQSIGPTSVNKMIAAYALKDQHKLAVEVFNRFHGFSQATDVNTFISLLGTCDSVAKAKEVYKKLRESGLKDTLRFENSLISRLGRLGAVAYARKLLGKMPERNVVSWSAMIAAYVQNGYSDEALVALQEMDLEGVKPNNITFTSLVDAIDDEVSARAMQNRIFTSGEVEVDDFLYNAVLRMCLKFHCIDEARGIFESAKNKDVVTWTTMIAAASEDGRSREAFSLFRRMELEGVKPTSVTFMSLLDACSSATLEALHERVVAEGHTHSSALLCTALVKVYGKHNQLERARGLFDEMESKDVVSWTSMIRGYIEQEQGSKALSLFRQMELEGVKPSQITLVSMLAACSLENSLREGRKIQAQLLAAGGEHNPVAGNELVNMYGQCGSLDEARSVFNTLRERGVAAWTSMIAAYSKSGRGKEAVKMLRYMGMEGVKPNRMTLSTLLSACGHSGLANEAWECFIFVEKDCGVTLTSEQYGSMIDVLGRAGEMDQARVLLNNMPCKADAKIWTNFLGACRIHKNLELGAQAAEALMRIEPGNPSPYVLLARMYGEAGNRDKEVEVLATMEYRGIIPSKGVK